MMTITGLPTIVPDRPGCYFAVDELRQTAHPIPETTGIAGGPPVCAVSFGVIVGVRIHFADGLGFGMQAGMRLTKNSKSSIALPAALYIS
jgi:hypothetical protein